MGKLRSNPFKCIQAYVSSFSLSRDVHQTLDKSKTCQCFWKSLYYHHPVLTPNIHIHSQIVVAPQSLIACLTITIVLHLTLNIFMAGFNINIITIATIISLYNNM